MALGVGAAVASGGVAQASPDDTGGGTTTSNDAGATADTQTPDTTPSAGGHDASDPATSEPPKSKVGSAPEPGTGANDGQAGSDPADDTDATPDPKPDVAAPQHDSGTITDTPNPDPDPAPAASTTPDTPDAQPAAVVVDDKSAAHDVAAKPTEPSNTVVAAVTSGSTVAKSSAPVALRAAAPNALVADPGARQAAVPAAFVTTLAPPAPTPVFTTPSPIRFVLNVLSAIGLRPEAFPSGSPLAPLGSLLEFVYAGLRRIDHTLFNESPRAVVLTSGTDPYTGQEFGRDPVTGVVTGRVAYDPDDDLTWSVSGGPTYGAVEIHPDGTFTYMPDTTQVIPAGTTDSFSFTVTEVDSFHLHLLSGPGHTATGVVNLSVLPNNTVVATIDTAGDPEDLAINADGTRVYVTDRALGKVHVIDTATNTIVTSIPVGANPDGVTVVRAADGKEYVWVASSIGVNGDPTNTSNDIVTIIDTTTNTVIGSLDLTPPGWTPTTGLMGIQEIKANSDGSKVYVTGYNGVAVVDTASITVTKIIPMSEIGNTIAVAHTATGDFAYVADYDDKVTVIDMATDTKVTTIPLEGFNSNIAASPDGRYVYVAGNGVSVIDTETNTVVGTIDGVFDARGLVVSPDGARLYAARINYDDVAVIDTGTRSVIGMAPREDAWNVTVSPDGTKVYAVSFTADPDVAVIAVLPNPILM